MDESVSCAFFISFKDVESDDLDGAYDMLKYRLSEVCIDLAGIMDIDEIDTADKDVFC